MDAHGDLLNDEFGSSDSENIPLAGLPFDKDWSKFAKMVEKTEQPWESFLSILNQKGNAKHDTLGLFAKLITRSVTAKKENAVLSDKCGYTILVGCFRLCTHTHSLSSETTNDMLSMIVTEVRHFSTKTLSKSVEYGMEYMKTKGEDLPNRWMELFGKIISELFQHCGIDFEGDCISGPEYKTYIVNALCRLEWGNKNAPTMIAIIRELPEISDSDLDSVLVKVENSMPSIEPSVLPPLTHQLLHLAGNSKPSVVLNILSDYFAKMDYNSTNRGVLNGQIKALGTVLYYFVEGVKQYEPMIREILKITKRSVFDRELMYNRESPFMLALTLSLATQSQLKASIVEAYTNGISRYYQEFDWSFISAWCMQTRGSLGEDIQKLFEYFLKSKLFSLECVVEGVMHIGVALLTSSRIIRENTFCTTKCRELGSYLVLSAVKEDKKYLTVAMKELLKYPNEFSVECLSKCFEASTRVLSSSQLSAKMHELITQFPLMTVSTAAPIIKSLLPVFHLSSSLLDSLLIMTRKGVWKSVQSRLVSVHALILMLSYSPIIKDVSQDKFSQTQSIFGSSQAKTSEKIARYTGVFDNDALCFEIMSILRRFFTLQIEVRQQLYFGLHSTIRLNPELTNLICSNVHGQVKLYMTEDESAVAFDKILVPAQQSSLDPVTVEEDLGLLIQCLCCVTDRGFHVYSDKPDILPEAVTQCEELISKWIDLATELKLEDIL